MLMILICWCEMRRDLDVSKVIFVLLGVDLGKSSVCRYGVIWGDSLGDGLFFLVLWVGWLFLFWLLIVGL